MNPWYEAGWWVFVEETDEAIGPFPVRSSAAHRRAEMRRAGYRAAVGRFRSQRHPYYALGEGDSTRRVTP